MQLSFIYILSIVMPCRGVRLYAITIIESSLRRNHHHHQVVMRESACIDAHIAFFRFHFFYREDMREKSENKWRIRWDS